MQSGHQGLAAATALQKKCQPFSTKWPARHRCCERRNDVRSALFSFPHYFKIFNKMAAGGVQLLQQWIKQRWTSDAAGESAGEPAGSRCGP
ncbi:hypothetical protein pipiens_010383, partial [Culex pipiens pipiens]